ncbi:MAG: hypothetical protein QNL43_07345 [Crocinitomicaceae bacterium]|jgi:hypothetical protein|tara:strand:- start:4586 stop:4765 length:180 start_codon:yes stop_codon:yes gene_type:complete
MTYQNSGHHRDVATPNDLTSAKQGDIFYLFALESEKSKVSIHNHKSQDIKKALHLERFR